MWIKTEHLVPNSDRLIQIWLHQPMYVSGYGNVPAGVWAGRYSPIHKQFTGLVSPTGQQVRISFTNIHCWAEMFPVPTYYSNIKSQNAMEEKKEMPKPTTVYCLFTMEAGVVGSATHNLKACWFRKPHFNQLCKIFGIDLKLDSSESLEVVVDILALIQEHGTTLQKLADMYRQGDDVRMGDTYYRLREVECGKEIKPEMYG